MKRWIGWLALAGFVACSGDGDDDGVLPPGDADTDADGDTDADADTDSDTDADTDTDPPTGLCAGPSIPSGTVLGAGSDLATAIETASPGAVIELAPGTYTVLETVPIDKPLTITSQDRDPADTIITMNYSGDNLFDVTASDVTIAHVTLQQTGLDAVSVRVEAAPITGLLMHDVRVEDPGRNGVVLQGRSSIDDVYYGIDDSEIRCSAFVLSDEGRENQAAVCQTGVIIADAIGDFVIRDNYAEGFWCVGATIPNVVVKSGSRNVEITRNQIIDTRLGIQVGAATALEVRTNPDAVAPCLGSDSVQAFRTAVTNNIVAAHDEGIRTGGITAGIDINDACESQVLHNSVYVHPDTAQPGGFWNSIVISGERTSGNVANNLLSGRIFRPGDVAPIVRGVNEESAANDVWQYPFNLDFRTSVGATEAIDQGETTFASEVPIDIQGEPRDAMPDIGADEL